MGCCPKTPPPKMPGWGKRIYNFLYDLWKFLKSPRFLDQEGTNHRKSICSVCPSRKNKWCTWCGCWLPWKTKIASCVCPGGWWPTDPGFQKMSFKLMPFDMVDFDQLTDTTWGLTLGKSEMAVTFKRNHMINPGGRMSTTWWHIMGGRLQIYTSTGVLFATLTREGDAWAGRTNTRNTKIKMEKV